MTKGRHWQTAPTIADFEAMAADAYARLPADFREKSNELLIRIEDFATDDVLESLGIGNAYELLGLYHGVSLNNKSVMDVPRQPDMVFLYRRPILEEWAESGEALGDLITHVLVHEIGHHFGFSDDDMERIEKATGT